MSFDARKKEVLDALAKTDHSGEAKEEIRKLLDGYFSQREGRLANLSELLEPGRKDPCHRAWLDKTSEAMDLTHRAFKDAQAGKLWLAGLVNEEHGFFFNLWTSQVPVKRDRMMKQAEALNTAMREFDNKWDAIKSSDKGLDEKMQKVAEDYGKILEEAAKTAASTEKQAKERTAEAVGKAISLGLKAVDLGFSEKIIKGAVAVIRAALSEKQARRLEIFALISREELLFTSFKESREMVAEFLEDNGYPQIKDAWDDGDDAADALPGKMATDGQKADASELAKELKDELKNVFSAAEREYREFAKKHEYLFFGPLGSGYVQELMEDDTWKSFSDRWKRQRADFDELLRERTVAASKDKIFEVSLEGLTDDDKEELYERLLGPCQELLRAWNEFKDFSNDPYWALESREQLKSILDALR